MVVLIDPPRWPAHGTRWSHLVSDTSLAELHGLARRCDLPARSFDLDHYDVPAERYDDLVAAGAHPVSAHELIRREPGVHVMDEDPLGVNLNIGIRGLNPRRSSRVLLLEDGVPIQPGGAPTLGTSVTASPA